MNTVYGNPDIITFHDKDFPEYILETELIFNY